jgi:AcrR family transcriptional regulator
MTSKALFPSHSKRFLTPKGMATRAAILDTAHQVFRETGYYGSSISEITRRCGISMGNFYQYFKNKEQVFLELSDRILSRFMTRAESLPVEGLPVEERLQKEVQLLYEHTRENFAFHRILGESELADRVTIAYYEAIARHYRNFIRREARAGNLRSLDPNMIAHGLIGICYFHSLDWGEKEKTSPREVIGQMTDLILHGINGPASWKKPSEGRLLSVPDPVPLHSAEGEPLTKGENTRQDRKSVV